MRNIIMAGIFYFIIISFSYALSNDDIVYTMALQNTASHWAAESIKASSNQHGRIITVESPDGVYTAIFDARARTGVVVINTYLMRDAEKFRNGVLNYCTAMNGSGEKTYFNAESPIAALAWERPRLRPWNDFYKVMALVDPNDMYELRVYGEYFRLYFTEDDIRTYRKAEFD